jgi:hypothetical protein
MTDTEANKKIVDEFTQGLFSEGDLEAADEYLSVELVIHDPGSAPASARRGAALGLGDELRAAVWAGVCRCPVPVPRRLLALGGCAGGHEESRDPARWAGSTL